MAKDMQNENQVVRHKRTLARKKKPIRLPINWFDAVIIALILVIGALAISGTQLASLFGIGESSESCTIRARERASTPSFCSPSVRISLSTLPTSLRR